MNRRTATTALALTLAAAAVATGCSTGSITGEVDRQVVPPFLSSIVYQANELTPDDDVVAIAAFYSFSSSCDLVADQMRTKDDGVRGVLDGRDLEGLLDDVKKYEQDNFPEDYWAAYAVVSARSERDIEGKFDLANDPAGVLVCHHSGAVDAPRDEPQAALLPDYGAPFNKDRNRECYAADRGELSVSLYDPRKSISLVARDVRLTNADGDTVGNVELGGLGAQCDATEGAVSSLFRDVQDLAAASSSSQQSQPSTSTPAPAAGGSDSCQFAFDGECDEPGIGTGACDAGTDVTDCGG